MTKLLYMGIGASVLLLIIAIIMIASKKDSYQYYPFGSATPSQPHENVTAFFKAVGSPVNDSIPAELYERACNDCVTSNALLRPITPRNCELCKSYVKGHMLKLRPMGIL